MYFVHALICTNNSEMQRHWLGSLTAFLMEKMTIDYVRSRGDCESATHLRIGAQS